MKRILYFTALTLITTITLPACLDQEESELEKRANEEDQIIQDYLNSNNIGTERLNSGIYMVQLTENPAGTPVDDQHIVSIHYSLRTLNGNFIDSTRNVALPARFLHAQAAPNALFPRGVNMGVRHMRQGEKYRFFIPSYQAFDVYSFGQILPREAILIADVEVSQLEKEEEVRTRNTVSIEEYIQQKNFPDVQELSSGIYYQLLEEGSGEAPKASSLVEVHYKGYYLDDEVFDKSADDKPIKFFLGNGSVIPGFELGINQMKKGGKARIFIPSSLGFKAGVQVIPPSIREDFLEEYGIRDLRPYEAIIFELELRDIQ